MADIQGFDPKTGQPVSVPQEAAAQWYRDGKLAFKPGDRIPVVLNGVEGSMSAEEAAEAYQAGDAQPNFDPNGASKAYAAGTVSGLSAGASDWLAIEGQKLIDPEGAEKTRQSLDALQQEHGTAWASGEITGGIGSLFIPGGGEVEALRLGSGAEKAAAASRALGEAGEAAATGDALRTGAQTFQSLTDAHAAAGATKGSLLARTLRTVNPYGYITRAGQVAADVTGNRRFISPLARFATEGGLIGAANAVDESELGGTDLTGEAILANMEHGALWGVGLGLVGTGVEKIATSASRTADRLAEAQLGGSPTEMGRALDRFGPGTLGRRMLEEGWTPFMSAEETHTWAKSLHEKDGMDIGRVVSDADSNFQGVPAEEVHKAVLDNLAEAKRQYVLHGGSPALAEQLEKEVKYGLGLRDMPVKDVTPIDKEAIYKELWEKEGLPDPDKMKRPKKPSDRQIEIEQARAVRREIGPLTPDMVVTRQRELAEEYSAAVRTQNYTEQERLARMVANPQQVVEAERLEQAARVKARVKEEMLTPFRQAEAEFNRINADHNQLEEFAGKVANAREAKRTRDFERATAVAKEFNAQHRVSYENARAVRQKIDKLIPWNRSADAVTSAAVEMKRAARTALENKIEESLDREARKFKDPAIMQRYLAAKQRYGESAELEKMSFRGRNRHAGMFGRPSRVGGAQWPLVSGIGAVVMGHPAAGVMAAVGGHMLRVKGPKYAAWALHKAAKLAGVKALRQEVQIANRRAIRQSMGRKAAGETARLKIQDMPPHEARATAAESMEQVMRLGAVPAGLRARLSAQAPGLEVLAPKSFDAAERTFRSQVNWLIQQVPPRLMQQFHQEGRINPRDLDGKEARDFLEHANAAIDPRAAPAAMANGTLTANMVAAHKANWPNLHKADILQKNRMVAMDRDSWDYLPPGMKSRVESLYGDEGGGAFTMALQANNANAFAPPPPAPGKQGGPKGMSHAAATSKGMAAMVALTNSAAQTAESGPPGRRGRSGRSAEASGF